MILYNQEYIQILHLRSFAYLGAFQRIKKQLIRRQIVFGGHHVEIVKLLYEEVSNKIEFLKAISVMIERQSQNTLQMTNTEYTK